MTVSSVSSTLNTYQPDVQSAWRQRTQDFKALQTALQSGDLSGAQQAFAAMQKDQQNSSQATQASSASSQNSQDAKDFQALQTAFSSGDLSGAQQAFAALQKDLQGTSQAGHHHHHHGGSANGTAQAASSASSATATQTVGVPWMFKPEPVLGNPVCLGRPLILLLSPSRCCPGRRR